MALYVVGTPIGNLKDITLRALETLKNVHTIVAEDTRVSAKLLSRYEISKPLLSFHKFSSESGIQKIITLLKEGNDVAYIVDAGTPGISDPVSFLVRRVREEVPEVSIVPIPGPSALTAALSVAGIESNEFVFLGFAPHKKGRQTFFKKVYQLAHDLEYPVVLYESPHRILKTLGELNDIGLSRFEGILMKEISKVYEKIIIMSIGDLVKEFSKEKKVRGEFVLVINKNLDS